MKTEPVRTLPVLDVSLCLSAGQTFGWKKHKDDWLGADGESLYILNQMTMGDAKKLVENPAVFKLFGLSDFDRNERLLKLGPELEPMLCSLQGLRLMSLEGTVQSLFSFLCTPNNNIKRIEQMVTSLFSFGVQKTIENSHVQVFPCLERLAEVSEIHLRQLKFGYRARNIPVVAKELLARGGVRYLDQVKSATYQDVLPQLLSLQGVGPKLADCIALFSFGKSEAAPFDVHMWRAYKKLYGVAVDEPLTQKQYQKAGEHMRHRFGLDAGAAHQFIYCYEMMKDNPAAKNRSADSAT